MTVPGPTDRPVTLSGRWVPEPGNPERLTLAFDADGTAPDRDVEVDGDFSTLPGLSVRRSLVRL